MNRPRPPKQQRLSMGAAIPLGVVIGTALGVAFDNMPVGISSGIAMGIVIAFAVNHRAG